MVECPPILKMEGGNAMSMEAYPLRWPEGWIRTRIQDRKTKNIWKKTPLQYRENISEELEKLGARSGVVSTNVDPMSFANPQLVAASQRKDPGVAVYFSRPPADDFSWQEILGISVPDPQVALIDTRYRELAAKYHPDNSRTGDIEMFKLVNAARKSAVAWVTGAFDAEHQHVVACDLYTEIRWNMAAIRIALNSLRKLEECGASGLLERAFAGFKAIAENSSVVSATT